MDTLYVTDSLDRSVRRRMAIADTGSSISDGVPKACYVRCQPRFHRAVRVARRRNTIRRRATTRSGDPPEPGEHPRIRPEVRV